jgi:hypothetical protein
MKHDTTILSLLDQPITDIRHRHIYAVVKAMCKLLINYLKILKYINYYDRFQCTFNSLLQPFTVIIQSLVCATTCLILESLQINCLNWKLSESGVSRLKGPHLELWLYIYITCAQRGAQTVIRWANFVTAVINFNS